MRLKLSCLSTKFKDEVVHEYIFKKSMNIILVPSQKYPDSRYLLQHAKAPQFVMDFNNCTQRLTPPYYFDVDNPSDLRLYCQAVPT